MKHLKINGHYEEDSEEIIRRVKNILGLKYMGFSRGPKGRLSEVTFPLGNLKTEKEEYDLLETVEGVIKLSFAPTNKIQVSIEYN